MKPTLHQMVSRFHEIAGIPIHHRPHIPKKERVALRLRLITEEFFELLAACEIWPTDYDEEGGEIRAEDIILNAIKQDLSGDVNLSDFADALTDMDYINEGTRLEFGIDGSKVLEEVHRANMRKFVMCETCRGMGRLKKTYAKTYATGPNDVTDYETKIEECETCLGRGLVARCREDGKIIKCEGWCPPNIERVLTEQGWRK